MDRDTARPSVRGLPTSFHHLVVILSASLVFLSVPSPAATAAILIPPGASDSVACGLIEQEHARGLEIWRGAPSAPAGALARFKDCEDTLRKRSLWQPVKLPAKATADQRRAWNVTNSVIFSLAAVYQKLGRRAESERYADMARARGLLPKVFLGVRKLR